MVNLEQYNQLVKEAESNKSKYQKERQPYLDAWQQSQQDQAAIIKEREGLAEQIRSFEAAESEMSDHDYLKGVDRLRLLKVKIANSDKLVKSREKELHQFDRSFVTKQKGIMRRFDHQFQQDTMATRKHYINALSGLA